MIRTYAIVLISVFSLFGYYIYKHAFAQYITETEFSEELEINDNLYAAQVSLWRDFMPTTMKKEQTLKAAVHLILEMNSEATAPKLNLKKLYLINEENDIIWQTSLKQTSTMSSEYGIEGKAYDGPKLEEDTHVRTVVSFKIDGGETHYLTYKDAVVGFIY